MALFKNKLATVNVSKIGQVCLTDAATVESMLSEVWL